MTLQNTSFMQLGDGNPATALMKAQGAPAAFTTDGTATAAQIIGGLITVSGTLALTLPLAADLDTALPNFPVNGSFAFNVISIGANTATVTTNTGWSLVGTMTVLTTIASGFVARKTAAGAWSLYRAS